MQDFDNSIDGWDGSLYGNATPLFFTMYEGKAILFPTPDQSMVAGLKVLYNQKPAEVALLGDTLSLPAIYHDIIVKYCMWQASLLDEDHEPAVMYRNDFESDMNSMKHKETSDPTEFYPSITVMPQDQ